MMLPLAITCVISTSKQQHIIWLIAKLQRTRLLVCLFFSEVKITKYVIPRGTSPYIYSVYNNKCECRGI